MAWSASRVNFALLLSVVAGAAGTSAEMVVVGAPDDRPRVQVGGRASVAARVDGAHDHGVLAGGLGELRDRVCHVSALRPLRLGRRGRRIECALERGVGLVAREQELRRGAERDLCRRALDDRRGRGAVPSTIVHSHTAGSASTSRFGFSAVTSKVCAPQARRSRAEPPRGTPSARCTKRAPRRRASRAAPCPSDRSSTVKVNVASVASSSGRHRHRRSARDGQDRRREVADLPRERRRESARAAPAAPMAVISRSWLTGHEAGVRDRRDARPCRALVEHALEGQPGLVRREGHADARALGLEVGAFHRRHDRVDRRLRPRQDRPRVERGLLRHRGRPPRGRGTRACRS